MRTSQTNMHFTEWMECVDSVVGKLCGLSVYDLPDCLFADWFDQGMKPTAAARRAINAARNNEGGAK